MAGAGFGSRLRLDYRFYSRADAGRGLRASFVAKIQAAVLFAGVNSRQGASARNRRAPAGSRSVTRLGLDHADSHGPHRVECLPIRSAH